MEEITKPSHNLTHTFLIRPQIHFETQHADEEVVLVVRKHLLTQLYWIINTSLLLIVGFTLSISLLPQIVLPQHVFVFILFFSFFAFSYFWLNFLLWYFTVGIVTTARILDLDFFNVLYKEFAATVMSQVSELSTRVGGFFRSFFHFGDVFIKTQGFQQNIEFTDVPEPARIAKIINTLMQSQQKEKEQKNNT